MSGEVTFHPHAWGVEQARRLNKEINPDVPEVYHQAIIARHAADYVKQQLNPPVLIQKARQHGKTAAMQEMLAEAWAKSEEAYYKKKTDILPRKIVEALDDEPKPQAHQVFLNCQAHMMDVNSFRCKLCGKPAVEMTSDEY